MCFYDLKTFNLICKIEEISINRCIRALQITAEDFLIAAGYYSIYLINIITHQIINRFDINNTLEYNCVYLMKNGNILISNYEIESNQYSNICQY